MARVKVDDMAVFTIKVREALTGGATEPRDQLIVDVPIDNIESTLRSLMRMYPGFRFEVHNTGDPTLSAPQRNKELSDRFAGLGMPCPELYSHVIKISPVWFRDVSRGIKRFEIRKDDRGYRVGDTVLMAEWADTYTGAWVDAIITYISSHEQKPGFVVFGFDLHERTGSHYDKEPFPEVVWNETYI
jgi:hypothetical protein